MSGIDIPVNERSGEWHVDSPAAAEWALSKIAEERASTERIIEAANGMIEYYERQIDKAKNDLANSEAYFMGELRLWFDGQPKRSLKASYAIDLPSGKLSLPKEPKVEYKRDNAKLTEWLINNAGEFVVVKPEPDWQELKAHVMPTETGEVILMATGEVIEGLSAATIEPQLKVVLR